MLTAVELSLPIVFIVLNNGTLQIEREQMIKFYGRHSLTDYVLHEIRRAAQSRLRAVGSGHGREPGSGLASPRT